MADLPHTGQPEWGSAQSSPWITQNNLNRTFDGFCVKIVVTSRESIPPAECDDGERYLIEATASGDWLGEEGGVAIAKGDNAANGWIIVPATSIAQEGNEIYIVEERITLQRQAAGWVEGTIVFVDLDGAFDGAHLAWDQSNGQFFFDQPDEGGAQSAVVMTDADDYTMLAADVNKYIRMTAAGTKQVIIQDDAVEPLPANGEWHFRNVSGDDLTIVPDVYVVVNPPAGGTLVVEAGGTFTLKRIALNEFDLFGLVVAA